MAATDRRMRSVACDGDPYLLRAAMVRTGTGRWRGCKHSSDQRCADAEDHSCAAIHHELPPPVKTAAPPIWSRPTSGRDAKPTCRSWQGRLSGRRPPGQHSRVHIRRLSQEDMPNSEDRGYKEHEVKIGVQRLCVSGSGADERDRRIW